MQRTLVQKLLQRSLSTNLTPHLLKSHKSFSTQSNNNNNNENNNEPDWAAHFGSSDPDPLGWETDSTSWSTGLTTEHFDGKAIGKKVDSDSVSVSVPVPVSGNVSGNVSDNVSDSRRFDDVIKDAKLNIRAMKGFVNKWETRMHENATLMRQVREPGVRGTYLKDSEKAEMYKKHKENPEVYTVEKLAKEYRIMRQRVLAILWLKRDEEAEEIKRGEPLDDSVEMLIDTVPELFLTNDREFHVATLRYKPDFKVMPEGWDGTTKDPDEVHYEISAKEDEMLYQEFVQRFNFNKMKFENKVKCHKYSRRRPSEGWNFTIEKLGAKGKRGDGGGWKFVSEADGSTRPLNEYEKMFVKRETPRRRRRILP